MRQLRIANTVTGQSIALAFMRKIINKPMLFFQFSQQT